MSMCTHCLSVFELLRRGQVMEEGEESNFKFNSMSTSESESRAFCCLLTMSQLFAMSLKCIPCHLQCNVTCLSCSCACFILWFFAFRPFLPLSRYVFQSTCVSLPFALRRVHFPLGMVRVKSCNCNCGESLFLLPIPTSFAVSSERIVIVGRSVRLVRTKEHAWRNSKPSETDCPEQVQPSVRRMKHSENHNKQIRRSKSNNRIQWRKQWPR